MEFFADCPKCRDVIGWSSQEQLTTSDLNKGDMELTAAVLLGGKTYEDLHAIASNMQLQIMSESTFYR